MKSNPKLDTYRVGDIVDVVDYVVNGSFASLKDNVTYLNEPGYAMLMCTTDFNNGWNGNYVWVDEKAFNFLRKTELTPGDLVMSNVGSVGVVFEVPSFSFPMTLGPNSVMLRSTSADVDQKFLYYYFASPQGQDVLRSISTGSVQTKFNKTALRNSLIELPNISRQKQIAYFLAALDGRIALLRETNTTLETIAQALFKSWSVNFTPVRAKMEGWIPKGMDEEIAELFPDGLEESEFGLVPRGWQFGRLADLAEFQNGYAFRSKDWVSSGHPVVKIGDVKPGIIDLSGCSYIATETAVGLERFKLHRGDLLVGMTGYVGETGLVPDVQPVAYLNQRVGRISTENSLKDRGFVYCLVRNPAFKAYAESQSHGSAQANVSGSALLNYSSAIPTPDVLSKFNDLIHPMLEAMLSNHEKAQTLASL